MQELMWAALLSYRKIQRKKTGSLSQQAPAQQAPAQQAPAQQAQQVPASSFEEGRQVSMPESPDTPTPVTGHVDQSRRARKRARAARDKEQGSEDQPSNSRASIKPRKGFNTEPLVRDDEDVPMPTVIAPHSEGSKSRTSEKPHKGFNTEPLVRDNDGDAPCQLLMHLTVKGASKKRDIYIVSDASDKLISTKRRPGRARPTLGESNQEAGLYTCRS